MLRSLAGFARRSKLGAVAAVMSCVLVAASFGQAPAPEPTPTPTPPPFPPAVDAKAVITTLNGGAVPKTWPLGVPILLSAKISVAGTRETSVGWSIEPAWVDQNSARLENNRVLSVGTGTKTKRITIVLTVAKADTFDSVRTVIEAVPDPNEPGVDPAPTPTPTPTPVPPIPSPVNPLSQRAQKIADLVNASVAPYEGRAATAAAIAGVYANAATNISKAAALNPTPADLVLYTTPEGIVKATGATLKAALGTSVTQWTAFFNGNLRPYLNELGTQGVLDTPADHIPVFQDIAAGLRSVK